MPYVHHSSEVDSGMLLRMISQQLERVMSKYGMDDMRKLGKGLRDRTEIDSHKRDFFMLLTLSTHQGMNKSEHERKLLHQ